MKTTSEAFEELISARAWWKGIFNDRRTANTYVIRFRRGTLTEETMSVILEKAGYKTSEKTWSKDADKSE